MAINLFQNPNLINLSSAISDVDKTLQEISQKNPTSPDQMTSEQLKAAGYTLGTTTVYDSDIGYFEVPAWLDPKGNAANFNTSQIQRNDYQAAADKRRTEEIQGNFTYIPVGGDEEGGIAPTSYVKIPNAKIGYETPQDISRNAVFQDVNAFSGGQLGKIADAINSGQYKITDDKSQMVTKYGTYNLTPLGNGLYDIPIGARVGSYNVAIGINDKGQAIFDKNFLDNGAVRYRGGSAGGMLQNFVQDIGPVGNIALAVATGGLSIPEQIAAQTAYNMVGGADFENALKGAALNVALSEGVKASGLLGGGTQSNLTTDINGELIPFDEGLTGIDIGDVIPATPEQLAGLYGTGGVFNPPVDTTGIDMGDVIPATEAQLRGLYETQGIFRPPMEGIDMGETIPFTSEQIAGLYPIDNAFIPPGIDIGDTIPYTQEQIAGLYPTEDSFRPPVTNVVDDYFKPDSTLTTPITMPSLKDLANAAVVASTINSLVNQPSMGGGTTTGGGGFNMVPIPSDWKSPTYNQQFTPTDLNKLFTTANLLKGTQWENLPPEIKFAAAPTMEALTNMISNGQTTARS
jgi:hypothetical protein